MPEDSPFSFASIQNAGDAPVMPDPPELQNLHQNLAQMRDFQVNSKLQADLSADPTAGLKSMKIKNDGTFQAEGSVQALQSLMKDRQDLNQIRGAFHQQAMQYENRARMQENQPPWVQLATSLAGNLATAPNMPGWVQALGRTSQELNPRADQLRGVERQIMGEEAGISEKLLGSDIATQRTDLERQKFGIDVARESRLTKENQIKDLLKVESDASMAARKDGIFDKDLYVKQRVAMGDKPETALASAERLDSVAGMARKRNEDIVNAKDAKEAGVIERFYAGLSAQADRTDKMIAAADQRAKDAAARGDAAKQAKLEEPPPTVKKQLADLGSADVALDEIEKVIKDPKNAAWMGPGAGRVASIGAAVGVDPGGRIAGIKQKLMQQTAQAIKATGAGARGFGPQERPYFEQMAEGITRTPEQNLKILQGWREYLDQERRGIVGANPDVKWEGKFAGALGPRMGAPKSSGMVNVTDEDLKRMGFK